MSKGMKEQQEIYDHRSKGTKVEGDPVDPVGPVGHCRSWPLILSNMRNHWRVQSKEQHDWTYIFKVSVLTITVVGGKGRNQEFS